ncbi:MAG: DUF1697 domain-containing protein [Alphaproteobacteria bacterium]|nr:DUF1697 domain-containing protein [Alphaproteobacteria bacterium]
MSVFIALFRGVNVGGHNKLPMAQLRALVSTLGVSKVETYIQSGNAVFALPAARAKTFPEKLSALIERDFGYCPHILMLEGKAFQKVLRDNPYAAANTDPSKLHVMFLEKKADTKLLNDIQKLLVGDEELSAVGKAIFLNAPAGIGRSKAAEKLTKAFPDGTSRNWRSCLKLAEMADTLR